MQKEDLGRFENWFAGYVSSFYGKDEYTDANIKLKEDHTREICSEMDQLTDELALKPAQKLTAGAIALFHDIGRFQQFTEYQTYIDARSINHCCLGLEILQDHRVLDDLAPAEKHIIETAIRLHGVKQLPDGLDPECALFVKLIRDADKLDIYRVLMEKHSQYRQNPENFQFEVEFADEPYCSKHVVEGILSGERVNYDELQTINDMKLMQLGWVFDVNFPQTLVKIRQKRFLEQIIDFLPKTDDIARVSGHVLKYVDQQISDHRAGS